MKRPKVKKQSVKLLGKLLRNKLVYDIAGGIRGPDRNSYWMKAATSGVIRHTIGLRHGVSVSDCEEYACWRRAHNAADTHFLNHARAAFQALGLSWSEVNVQPKHK